MGPPELSQIPRARLGMGGILRFWASPQTWSVFTSLTNTSLEEEQEDELLDAYTTPSKGSHKRSSSTPETPRAKRAPASRSPFALFSPGSFSPSVTPSQKYSGRGGRGEVVAAFGAAQGPAWSGAPRSPWQFGPFLDAKHEQVESCQLLSPFSDVFRLCLRTIIEGTRSSGSQLVLVPSLRDVSHHFVYPQPPFSFPDLPKEDRARVLLVPEPCTLDIDGVVLGLTSTDLLLHMGAEEISSSSGLSDRFTRILRHVLTQRSFYPLYPPSEELNVDFEALGAFAALPVTPDVLVTPSELRFFIKDVLGCVCINPGRLTKGQAGGTYGRLLLRRDGRGDRTTDRTTDRDGDIARDNPGAAPRSSPCVAAQVVRI
ncbi:DNA polymerase alpha subunit B [Geospiza fortis]|uniref:DNA polymerase alpha subunit B n=1 Tax=Geospiza fortis TaxID=48883 RepID=A0A8N5F632_GEOFO|nr:DNA polymerase alpha subunit B [Geospiza fortis]